MSRSFIKLAVALIAPAMIVSSTASGQGDKPLPPQDKALQPLTMEVVPSTIVSSAFAYQGQLRQNNLPVTGTCSATFKLFDAETAGNQIGATVDMPTLQVQNGLFTVALDFGWGAFNGEARWLETAVGCGQRPVTLSPRMAVRPTPYALALPGMRTVLGIPDFYGNPTMSIVGGLVSGPISNTVSPDSINSVIGGGSHNRVNDHSAYSVIAGGVVNLIDDYSSHNVIAGGIGNLIDHKSSYNFVAGSGNTIDDGSGSAVIAGGYGNLINNNADYAVIPGGYQAHASFLGQQAYASGGFSGIAGTAQTSVYVLRNLTTDAQLTLLYLDGAISQITLPAGRGMIFDIQVIGESDSATAMDIATYHFIGAANNYGTGFTLSPVKTVVHEDPGALSWDANFSRTGNTLNIVVAGENNHPVRWVATVRTTEVEWPTTAMDVQNMPAPITK